MDEESLRQLEANKQFLVRALRAIEFTTSEAQVTRAEVERMQGDLETLLNSRGRDHFSGDEPSRKHALDAVVRRVEELEGRLKMDMSRNGTNAPFSADGSFEKQSMHDMWSRIRELESRLSSPTISMITVDLEKLKFQDNLLQASLSQIRQDVVDMRNLEAFTQDMEQHIHECREGCLARHKEVEGEIEAIFKGEMKVGKRLQEMERQLLDRQKHLETSLTARMGQMEETISALRAGSDGVRSSEASEKSMHDMQLRVDNQISRMQSSFAEKMSSVEASWASAFASQQQKNQEMMMEKVAEARADSERKAAERERRLFAELEALKGHLDVERMESEVQKARDVFEARLQDAQNFMDRKVSAMQTAIAEKIANTEASCYSTIVSQQQKAEERMAARMEQVQADMESRAAEREDRILSEVDMSSRHMNALKLESETQRMSGVSESRLQDFHALVDRKVSALQTSFVERMADLETSHASLLSAQKKLDQDITIKNTQMRTDLERQVAANEQRLNARWEVVKKDTVGADTLVQQQSDFDERLEDMTTSLRLQLQELAETLAIHSEAASARLRPFEDRMDSVATTMHALEDRIVQLATHDDLMQATVTQIRQDIVNMKQKTDGEVQEALEAVSECKEECGSRHAEVQAEVESMFKGEMRLLQRLAEVEKKCEQQVQELGTIVESLASDREGGVSAHLVSQHDLDEFSHTFRNRISEIEEKLTGTSESEPFRSFHDKIEEIAHVAEQGASTGKRLDAFTMQVRPQAQKGYCMYASYCTSHDLPKQTNKVVPRAFFFRAFFPDQSLSAVFAVNVLLALEASNTCSMTSTNDTDFAVNVHRIWWHTVLFPWVQSH
jgi:hypothetical protein